MNSKTVRWLVDVEAGGPPRAFECLLVTGLGYSSELVCGKVTRTLSGMRAHQRVVHAFQPQAELFSETAPGTPAEEIPEADHAQG